jgi:hypothetical protein
MADGYDPAKAAEFNNLILQGIEYDEALIMAEIPLDEIGNYSFDPETSILSRQEGPPVEESVFDPRQDPGENVFDPGTTYTGPPVEESVFDPRQDPGENVFDPTSVSTTRSLISPAPVNDPYAGLTADQIRLLGSADPTDPYIRARLGIPQLSDSPLAANASFGTVKTGVPILDTAISSIGNLFGFSNTKTGTTTGLPASTPNTAATAQAAAVVRVQDPALTDDEDQNLQNIVGAQGEIVRAEENIQANNRSILANEEAQAEAQEQQRQAQAIIDQNDAELADATLSDERRAELEANNAAQRASIAQNAAVIDEAQNNIDDAISNNDRQQASIETNQTSIAENAEAFTANNNNLNAPVDPFDDPELAQTIDDPIVEADVTLTILSEEETNALFDGVEPGLVDNLVAVEPANFEPTAVDEFTNIDEQVALEAVLQEPPLLTPEQVDAELATAAAEADQVENFDPTAVDEFAGIDEQVAANENALQEPPLLSPEEVDAELDAAAAEAAEQFGPDNVDSETDPSLPADDGTTEGIQNQINDQNAAAEAAARERAKSQATLQARYKQPASSDWRVRLQLAPNADYLYKDRTGSTILAPLYETDGVIFPYTPQIETSYNANYEMYDLTHSNIRGYFYKNSRVNDINIRATFTAQDTQEANYLLAVIHFFRSVTKMFYGAKDAYRGAPPPLTYLSGLGQYQFNQHPCVVSQFNYSLPNDVDYIRAGAPNNYGTNLLTQRARTGAIAPEAGNPSLTRLLGTLTKPPVSATVTPPSPSMINQNVNNLSQATYVPTKIEISLTLLPVNTRSQVSTQFNMKDFASGALIKGGFW